MIYRFSSLLFLLLAMFWGCQSSDEPTDLNDDVQDPCDSTYQASGDTVLQEPVDSVLIYLVLSITSGTSCWTIEEFAELVDEYIENDTLFSIYDYDFPMAIRLDNYHSGEIIRGSVNLYHLGWTEMDSIYYTGVDRFLVRPEEQLGKLQVLTFSDVEITSSYMSGFFEIWIEGVDIAPLYFLAEEE